jgi:hypothetical protein
MSDTLLDGEALRLLKAFVKIKDAEVRNLIVTLTEAAVRGATVKIESRTPVRSGPDNHSLN